MFQENPGKPKEKNRPNVDPAGTHTAATHSRFVEHPLADPTCTAPSADGVACTWTKSCLEEGVAVAL